MKKGKKKTKEEEKTAGPLRGTVNQGQNLGKRGPGQEKHLYGEEDRQQKEEPQILRDEKPRKKKKHKSAQSDGSDEG